ncbi:MAG TPA: hypothetical protein VJG32_11460 [Anaerolineae bacterium]|nr:hypothetical protein [Anaerolineae bacterium]
MSKSNDELERLRRIREQQLRARDPTVKDKAFYGTVSARRKHDKLTLGGILKDFEHKWTWMFAGGILGLIIALVLAATVKATWVPLVAGAIIFAGLVVGRVLGAVMDWRNDDWQRK